MIAKHKNNPDFTRCTSSAKKIKVLVLKQDRETSFYFQSGTKNVKGQRFYIITNNDHYVIAQHGAALKSHLPVKKNRKSD